MLSLIRLITLSLFWFGCCGSYFPPSPTSRNVTPADLAGVWEYRALGSGTNKVMLILYRNGTFDQTITTPSQTMQSSGTWTINGSDVAFDQIMTDFNGWRADAQAWRIIDRDQSPAGFAILGGADDPDLWDVFSWLGPESNP